jgi:diacylglycerol kinase (ATP)
MRSFIYAFKGLKSVFRSEKNIAIHSVIALLVIVCGVFFRISRTDWLIVFLCIGMVFAAEIFNTAIEHMVDLVSPGKNEKAGMIKDISAGAVFILAIISAIAGLIIFGPHLAAAIRN